MTLHRVKTLKVIPIVCCYRPIEVPIAYSPLFLEPNRATNLKAVLDISEPQREHRLQEVRFDETDSSQRRCA